MKQAIVLAASIACLSLSVSANNRFKNGVRICTDSTQTATLNINDVLQEMVSIAGLQTNFELKEANVLNIEASVSHKKKYILYNPAFIASLNAATRNNKWALMTLLAHEIGHHLNGHTKYKGGSTPELELQADEFAGYVMYKLGATLLQSQNIMFYIARIEQSKTHPGRSSRLQAIEKGWNKAAGTEEQTAIVAR